MATNLEIAGAVKRTQKGAADWYYGGDNEAWPDMATALANIPASVRPGKTIGIFAGPAIVEYWWPTQAVADINLVPKTPDLSAYATTGYVDSSLVSAMKLRGDWDISTATYPTTGGSGTGGAIKEGNAWRISTAGTIGAQSFEVGDFIVALTDSPAQTPTNWTVLEHNNQQATETTAGTTKIATQATTQTETTTNDTDTVTPKKLWQGITRYASIAWTIIGDRIFNGLVSIVRSVPELRFVTQDGAYARFQRNSLSNTFQLKNNVLEAGGIGKSVIFTASLNQYWSFADDSFPTKLNTPFTVCFWVKVKSGSTGATSLINWGNTAKNFGIYLNDGIPAMFINTGAASGTNVNIADDIWHHILLQMTTGSVNIYLDGNYKSGLSTTSDNVVIKTGMVTNVYIGGNFKPTNCEFDQILVYDRTLTTTSGAGSTNEIAQIYGLGAGSANVPTFGLVDRFEFEAGTGTNVDNLSTDLRPMTLWNGATWNNLGHVPVAGASSEMTGIELVDGITNGEKGWAKIGDFNGRTMLQGRWFQMFQNTNVIWATDNYGNMRFDASSTNFGVPLIASNYDFAGNMTIGADAAGLIKAPINGLYVQEDVFIGGKIKINYGLNASVGTDTLINGTITINTTAVTLQSIIFFCIKVINGTPGFLYQGTISNGASFIINSSSDQDNSTINWWIIN